MSNRGKRDIIKRKKIIDTKKDFYYLDILKNIPEEYWNQEIWLQVPDISSPIRKDAHKRLRDFLNERFILYQLIQLGLDVNVIEMTLREVWYYIEILAERDNMVMDTVYDSSFTPSISKYCKRIQEKIGVDYWGYVYDVLKIKAKARTTIYEDVNKPVGLDKDTLKNYTEVPFFLILCEKEDVITAFLKEIMKKGYNKDYFYCLNLGGEASSNAIRLLHEYVNVKNFHCFVLHDMDMSGLEIFFDMKRHFNCKSIGVNPDFLEYCGYDFDKLCENYKDKKGKKLELVPTPIESKTRTIFNELDISIEEKEMYNLWIEKCIKKRIELNSITAHKIESNPSDSKVIDFINYFIHILEQEKWNLTRVRELKREGYSRVRIEEKITKYRTEIITGRKEWTIKPRLNILGVVTPDFIYNVEKKGKDIFTEENKAFLEKTKETTALFYDFYSQITDIFNNMNEKDETIKDQKIDDFMEENRHLFDIYWDDIIELKKNSMEYGVKMLEKYLRLKSIKEYIITKRKLMNYIGSINHPEFKVRETEEEMGNIIFNYKFNENKKIRKLNKILKRCLKRTDVYNEAKKDALKLTEDLDKLEVKEDKRLEFLENFKERIKETFTELIGDLVEFNNKVND